MFIYIQFFVIFNFFFKFDNDIYEIFDISFISDLILLLSIFNNIAIGIIVKRLIERLSIFDILLNELIIFL